MTAQWTPMRWPDGWKDPGMLDLLKGTAIDHLLIGTGPEWSAVRSRAQYVWASQPMHRSRSIRLGSSDRVRPPGPDSSNAMTD